MSDGSKARLARYMALYTAARLGIVLGLALAILGVDKALDLQIPIVLLLIVALLVGSAISVVALRSMRQRVNQEVRAVDEQRRKAREEPQG